MSPIGVYDPPLYEGARTGASDSELLRCSVNSELGELGSYRVDVCLCLLSSGRLLSNGGSLFKFFGFPAEPLGVISELTCPHTHFLR